MVDALCVLHKEGQIEVVRIKERFLEAPSAGGWRGVCVCVCVRGDSGDGDGGGGGIILQTMCVGHIVEGVW